MVTCCPKSLVTADAWELAGAADLAEKGHWYSGSGWGNEVAVYVDAVKALWGYESRIIADLRARAAKK